MKRNLSKSMSYAFVLLLMLSSCSKDDDRINDPIEEVETPATIYISGYSNEIAHEVIWKNGTAMPVYSLGLLSSGYVRYGEIVYDMDIVNDDVYAVWRMGYKAISSYYATANIYLWKNGDNTVIKENDVNIYPRAIDIHGTDVYFAGHYVDQYEYPSIWKNGNRQQLPGGTGTVNDLLVNNTDVLAVGYVTAQSSVAALWKNGVLTKLGEGYGFSAYGIAQTGNDTYVVGEGNINGPSGQRSALLWKNGTQQALENPVGQLGASANAVALTDSKICVAGYTYAGQTESMRAVVWIDGKSTVLSQIESKAHSVAVKGNTVYICGYEKSGAKYVAMMWKITGDKMENVKLSNGTEDAEAYCIKVK